MTPWALSLALHGDVKSFFFASFPFPWIGEEPDPVAQGIADFRLKLEVTRHPWRFDVHHTLDALPASPVVGSVSGVGLTAPELVDLTWEADTGDSLVVRGRIDRLSWSIEAPHVTFTAGRQPVSFGVGTVFTPMDIVNPFSGATIDTEYKPGVDALRVDLFSGTSARTSVVAAWVGDAPVYDKTADPGLDDLVLGGQGAVTVGTTDLIGLVLAARAEPVFGAGFAGSIGPVGVHGEGTLTLPAAASDETDPFVRVVLGADGRPTTTTTITGEVYTQTFGASDPADYLGILAGPRFQRGEVWTVGRFYGALAVSQEITPLLVVNAAVIANLEDPSALVAPGISWSVSDDAVVVAGMYAGVGERPDRITVSTVPITSDLVAESVQSEFGLYPISAYVQMKAYF